MTRISFYVLKGDSEINRQNFVCRLIEKAYYQGHQIYIHTNDEQQTEQINQILWSFRSDSFIPHQLANSDNEASCPILLGHDSTPPRMMDLLINLADHQPLFFSQFIRVAEFINDNSDIKTAGRNRYSFYKERGYELDTFTI